jgi:uncharacterized membrane protein
VLRIIPIAALVIQPYVLWPWIAGSVIALIGLLVARVAILSGDGWDKFLAVGPLCFGAPLAAFGAEHLVLATGMMNMVPHWIPWHLFWIYFVGCALILAALSFATNMKVSLSGFLVGLMFCLFVVMLHIPRVMANPRDRFAWAVAFRDLSFAGGAWALAGSRDQQSLTHTNSKLAVLGRFMIAVPAIFFAVEHLLHPANLPGVPLEKLTPAWIPGRWLIGYLIGAVLLAAGVSLLLGKNMRLAATYLGVLIVIVVLLVYLPMVIAIPSAADGGQKIEGLNYFFDTVLFGGAVLCLALAMPKRECLADSSSASLRSPGDGLRSKPIQHQNA